jgi:hypothetical protein
MGSWPIKRQHYNVVGTWAGNYVLEGKNKEIKKGNKEKATRKERR